MEMGVRETARWLGVSDRRVQAMAQAGRLPARQVSGSWLIDSAKLGRPRARTRPMSPRVARALVLLIDDPRRSPADLVLDGPEHHRLRGQLRKLLADEDPAGLLAAWLAKEGRRSQAWAAHPRDLQELLEDPRVAPTGISDPRADVAVSDEVEAWVSVHDLQFLADEHLLVQQGETNVVLHVSDEHPERPVPVGRLIADLSSHAGPRESEAVRRLLHEHLGRRTAPPQQP